MKFSIIIPSYLGDYKGSAKNKPDKFRRAIQSVFNQTFQDFEIVVIADACQQTVELCKELGINCLLIEPKQPVWSGNVRNTGIQNAKGDWITYLDIDDYFGVNHLQILSNGIDKSKTDWIWFDDYDFCTRKKVFRVHKRNIRSQGNCGTSNICHKRELAVHWTEGYLHDWLLIKQLSKFPTTYIGGSEYYIAHSPFHYDIALNGMNEIRK